MLSGLSFVSCGVVDEIPQQEWEYKQVEYAVGENNILLDCYCIFSEEDFTYQGKSFKSGMTLMIVPEFDTASDIISEVLGDITDKQYILKNYPLNAAAEVDDTDGKKSFKMTKTKWGLMYYGLAWDERDSTDPKTYVKKYTEFENIKDSFSFSTLLKQFIVAKLLA